MLVVVGGLPGTGKSTLAAAIGERFGIPVFAKDVIEASLWRSGIGAEQGSWQVAEDMLTTLAGSQLAQGSGAVLDTVARVAESRAAWRQVAAAHDAPFVLVECVCSDDAVHRSRLDGRTRAIPAGTRSRGRMSSGASRNGFPGPTSGWSSTRSPRHPTPWTQPWPTLPTDVDPEGDRMGITSTGYKIVLLLHIVCAIVGFGGVILNGLYGREAKNRPGPGGLAIQEANLFVSQVAEYFIYAVFILGIGLVFMSDDAWKFSQTWIWLAIVLYAVGISVSHAVLFPNAKRMRDLSAELVAAGPPPADAPPGPPPQVAEMERRGKTLGAASTFLHLLLVVIIILMIWKPGA